jgi:hypothetical protein
MRSGHVSEPGLGKKEKVSILAIRQSLQLAIAFQRRHRALLVRLSRVVLRSNLVSKRWGADFTPKIEGKTQAETSLVATDTQLYHDLERPAELRTINLYAVGVALTRNLGGRQLLAGQASSGVAKSLSQCCV